MKKKKQKLPKTIFIGDRFGLLMGHSSAEEAAKWNDKDVAIVGRYELVETLKVTNKVTIESI